jgi:type IV secretory pathway VirB4 component
VFDDDPSPVAGVDATWKPSLTGAGGGVAMAWHRATTAHVSSVYPFQTGHAFGARGVLLGANVSAGNSGFYYDGFEFYDQGFLTNPNVWISGDVGTGKSATIKALIRRSRAVFGNARYVAVIDPKGEYDALAAEMGLTVVKISPKGGSRINPMDAGARFGIDAAVLVRQQLAAQLVAGVLKRPLDPLEHTALDAAVARLSTTGRMFTLTDLGAAVVDADTELVVLTRRSPEDLAAAVAPVSLALHRLCEGSLRGMFDAETNVDIDWDHGPGVVLNIADVFDNEDAFPLVMLAVTVWLREALRNRPGRKSIQVIDEAWAAIRHGAAYFQSSLKLSRTHGVATVLAMHKPSDLSAQADDGTAAAKIAAGLLPDIQTRVLLRHPPERDDTTANLFGLSEPERQWIHQLPRGRAIWRVGDRAAVVHNVLTPTEQALFDTDHNMRTTSAETPDGVAA